tara:strand:+ start:14941 stop:16176 length:1236 start_codon:yes stop_codon:yes gene_type:complete
MITREALRVLHQQSNFIGGVNRQYDDRFAQSGAKIGTSLNVRMPSKYSVRTGATLSAEEHFERSTPLTVSSQYGVDVSFTSVELTMELDDFSDRILKPAMAQLAAKIEGDALAVAYKRTFNYSNASTDGLLTYKRFQQNGANITKELGPTSDRTACLTPDSVVEFNDAVKGLYQASENIRKQYREGSIGRTGGFDVYENTLLPSHTTGSLAGSPLTNGTTLGTATTANSWVSQTDLSVDGATSTTTLKAGDIITIAGVYGVHPETKVNKGVLQTFVVQSDVTLTTAANAYTVTVKPGMMYGSGNAYQNCVLSGVANTDGNAVSRIGAASSAFNQDLFFHKDAFVFASADLEDVSKYGAWGARAEQDGISMRVARQYAISSDTIPCRIDVLWGFAELYPELASVHRYEQDLL